MKGKPGGCQPALEFSLCSVSGDGVTFVSYGFFVSKMENCYLSTLGKLHPGRVIVGQEA